MTVYNDEKIIAKSKDYEGNNVTMIETMARGYIGDRNDATNYTHHRMYVVLVEYTFDYVNTFLYLDKVTAFNMFRKFLVK